MPAFSLLLELAELDRESERAHHLARRRGDARRAHDRRDGSEDAADLLLVDANLGGGFERSAVRGRGRVDRDERSDAHEHQRLLVEAGRLERVSGHFHEQVENLSPGGLLGHEVSFR